MQMVCDVFRVADVIKPWTKYFSVPSTSIDDSLFSPMPSVADISQTQTYFVQVRVGVYKVWDFIRSL